MRSSLVLAGVLFAFTIAALIGPALATGSRSLSVRGPVPLAAGGTMVIKREEPPEEEITCTGTHFAGEIEPLFPETVGVQFGRFQFAQIERCQNGAVVTFQLPLNWHILYSGVVIEERGNVVELFYSLPEIAILVRATFENVVMECLFEGEGSGTLSIREQTLEVYLSGGATAGLGTTNLEDCPSNIEVTGVLRLEAALQARG